MRATIEQTSLEAISQIDEAELPQERKTREQIIKARVNQAFFRRAGMAAYNSTCCITGIQTPSLLIAGHISSWGIDEKNRLNPRNGLAINALHDKAFEEGLLTITPDYIIRISSLVKDGSSCSADYFQRYDNKKIILPSKFLPDKSLLDHHNNSRFIP